MGQGADREPNAQSSGASSSWQGVTLPWQQEVSAAAYRPQSNGMVERSVREATESRTENWESHNPNSASQHSAAQQPAWRNPRPAPAQEDQAQDLWDRSNPDNRSHNAGTNRTFAVRDKNKTNKGSHEKGQAKGQSKGKAKGQAAAAISAAVQNLQTWRRTW